MTTFAALDTVLLARLQFAFTVSFHIVFPAFTIGLSAYIATLLVLWQRTDRALYLSLARFWTRIFAVSFAMGVVSGIVLSYQFGTNWSRFSVVVGNTIGPLIGYEVLTAFFLEATFLGVLLFGRERVPQWLYVVSGIVVALGTALSAFWILAANSWMQTPDGFTIRNGIAMPESWFRIIFNPSFPYRFAHMVIAAYLTTALVVVATAARYIVERRFADEARIMLKMGLAMVVILAPLQVWVGDLHGLNTAAHQPAKIAAIEAHWDGSKPAPLVLFAWPDEQEERNRAELSIPGLGSLIIRHDPDGLFPGLKDFSAKERPPVWPVFWAFRVMVGLGLLMLFIGFAGAVLWWRGKLLQARWFLRPLRHAWPLGFIAILAGWMVTEIGRQPWLAYGLLRTADAVSPIAPVTVAVSLALFVLVYGVVFSIGIVYIRNLIRLGPPEKEITPEPASGLPNRPLSAAETAR
ncbi:MAG: cytochrome ubiquinol oxidase subunit I [Burkholderiales bacterium]|nr:cytochrome ubiquinol oxidase subunit I [Burkholderiales bacterium]